MKRLSILICSLHSRKVYLDRLLYRLKPQLNDSVEVIIETDNREISTGQKRNNLIAKSSATYCSQVDDDDLISYSYINKILEHSSSNPDVIGISGIMTTNKESPRKFVHSLQYNRWFEQNGIYYRCPNHLNPIKTEIAKTVKFVPKTIGEDKIWSESIYPLLKTESFIDEPIYYYLYGDKTLQGVPVPIKSQPLSLELLQRQTINGQFDLACEVQVDNLYQSGSALMIQGNYLIFDSQQGNFLLFEGNLFNQMRTKRIPRGRLILEGTPFNLMLIYRENRLRCLINHTEIFNLNYNSSSTEIGFRPVTWKSDSKEYED